MAKRYRIDGQPVAVTWRSQQRPPVYTILIGGVAVRTSIEKTRSGSFLVVDAQGRPLGTFPGLRLAVEHLVREEQRQ